MADDDEDVAIDFSKKKKKKKPKALDSDEEEEKPAAKEEKPAAADDDDDESLDFSKKKKKKKPVGGDDDDDDGPTPPPPAPKLADDDDDDDSATLDLSKKKKKKKPKADADEEEAAEKPPPAAKPDDDDDDDDEVLDFSKVKKKKKKPKEEEEAEEEAGATGAGDDDDDDEDDDDDDDDDGAADFEGAEGEGGFMSIPADREYKYEELLDRMYSLLHANNPELAGDRKRFLIKPPQVVREGSKRVVLTNFGEICKTLNRSMDHVYSFMLAEMGTTGSIDASSRMVIKGRFPPKAIEQIIRRYVGEYVSCSSCKSPATQLQKQNRLYFMQCNNCGARRSVTPIKTGFVAISRGARKKNRV